MSDSNQEHVSRIALHYMLKAALLEIRASNTVVAAHKFADIFHALPMALLSCSTMDECDRQFEEILERAKRFGLEEYVGQLKRSAMKNTAGHMDTGSRPPA